MKRHPFSSRSTRAELKCHSQWYNLLYTMTRTFTITHVALVTNSIHETTVSVQIMNFIKLDTRPLFSLVILSTVVGAANMKFKCKTNWMQILLLNIYPLQNLFKTEYYKLFARSTWKNCSWMIYINNFFTRMNIHDFKLLVIHHGVFQIDLTHPSRQTANLWIFHVRVVNFASQIAAGPAYHRRQHLTVTVDRGNPWT